MYLKEGNALNRPGDFHYALLYSKSWKIYKKIIRGKIAPNLRDLPLTFVNIPYMNKRISAQEHSGSKRTARNRRGLLSIDERNPIFKRDMTGAEKKGPLGAENDRKNRFW